MKKRKQNGFVIELMIVFMLVTFAFCMLITTYVTALNFQRKQSKNNINIQTDLNQVGEYYIRYIEESGEGFPTGSEKAISSLSAAKYDWMDDEAKEFFINFNKKYNFEFSTTYCIYRKDWVDFFKEKYVWRKLIVSSDNKTNNRMIVELKERRVSNNDTEYYIQNWSTGDHVEDESAAAKYEPDNLGILQKLWMFLGLQIDSLQTWTAPNNLREVFELFETIARDTGDNWRYAMSGGYT